MTRLVGLLPVVLLLAFVVTRPGAARNALGSPLAWAAAGAVLLAAVGAGLLAAQLSRRAAPVARALVAALGIGVLVAPSYSQRTLVEPEPVVPAAAAATPSGPSASSAPSVPSVPTRSARLEGVGHRASGSVTLTRQADGSTLVRFVDVDIEGTPSPYVHLVAAGARTPDGGREVAELKAEKGTFGYVVPAQDGPVSVLVWCRQFRTPIAVADLA